MSLRKRSGGILGAALMVAAGLAIPASGWAGAVQAPAAVPESSAVLGSAAWASVQARRTGVQVPVPALTTETSTTVADPSGAFKLSTSAIPQRVRTAGGWANVDLTLRRTAHGGFAPAVSPADVVFSGGGNGALARFSDRGRWIELGWPGVLPQPVVSGDSATYPSVLPDVDLKVTASVFGFTEVLVVKTPRRRRTRRWRRCGSPPGRSGCRCAPTDPMARTRSTRPESGCSRRTRR